SQDLQHDPEFSDGEWARREGMTCFAGYPMVVERRTIGVLALFSRAPFRQGTLDNMSTVAAAIGQGIDRRRAEEDRDRLLPLHREARTRAEATERRLQQIVDALPEGVLVVDPDGRPLLLNAAAARIAGPTESDLDVSGYSDRGVWHMDGTPW